MNLPLPASQTSLPGQVPFVFVMSHAPTPPSPLPSHRHPPPPGRPVRPPDCGGRPRGGAARGVARPARPARAAGAATAATAARRVPRIAGAVDALEPVRARPVGRAVVRAEPITRRRLEAVVALE